ncbi:putative beta-barrel porin [Arcicella aurantiaca]|uniref:Putative beta-barrel porin n=1 Tax=Arcicella aurantiaca TaxID=591202 RepID=A0A316EDW7_9BACT|nr:putative porin [Arcicella aurantiaca]PWK29186.1 putative beta-barrel porin [Arcicella aurantiaca]
MKLRIYILTIIGLLFSGLLKAQFPSTTQEGGSAFPTNGFPTENQKDKDAKKAANSNGRIGLDDSTKVVYGPTSTRYFLEEDVVNNRKRLYNIDTIIDGIHNYNFVQRNKNLYQDLGNLGTAIRPVFYKAPEQIGTLLGYDAYTLYTFKPNQVRYYNTKSPFTNIIYVPGGGEQDLLQFELSRNIDSLWNVGLNVQRITANKTLIDQTSTGDNSSIGHWDFMVHSNYQTKNKKYSLLAYLNLSDHNSNDQGGVVVETGRDYQGMLALADNRPILTVASTRDNSYNLHVYHEYVGYKAFQIFQNIDYQTRRVRFGDKGFSAAWQTGFYPYAFKANSETAYRYSADTSVTNHVVLDSLYNESKYTNFEVKTGIKGFYKGFNYRMHLRTRIYNYTNPLKPAYNISNKNENFLGLWLNQYFKDSTRVFGEVEFSTDLQNLRINGEFQGKWLNVGGSFISTPATLVQQRTYNNGFRWTGELDNVKTTNVYAYTNLKFKQLVLRPSADITKIASYAYFDTLAYVQQSKKDIEIYRVGLGFDFRKGHFSTTNQIYYTTTGDEDKLMRIPKLFANSRVAFDLLYRKKLFIQTGLEFHYKSSYYADAYMPAIQQFHLQDKQLIEGYLQADAFADMRINRVRIFVKFAHVNKGLLGNGYYASPGFAGMGRVLAFGVHWLLFD